MNSESIKEIAAALAKAQGKMNHAAKDSTNPHFKSNYADLASVLDACREPLAENGLSVTQLPEKVDDIWLLKTKIMHASGEWIESYCPILSSKNDAQGFGSGLTYARRYALAAIVGVAQADDDGNAASQMNHQPQAKALKEKPAVKRQPQAQLSAMEKMELGKWVLTDGKYKGKKLGEIPQEEALSYREEMLRSFGNIDAMPDAAFRIFDNLSVYYSELI